MPQAVYSPALLLRVGNLVKKSRRVGIVFLPSFEHGGLLTTSTAAYSLHDRRGSG